MKLMKMISKEYLHIRMRNAYRKKRKQANSCNRVGHYLRNICKRDNAENYAKK